LKENVIIGKLIPAGTGFEEGPFAPQMPEPESYDELPVAALAEEGDGESSEEVALEADAEPSAD